VKAGYGARAALFVAGFSTIFVALGASASMIGALLRFYSNELAIVAGIAIIVMGLHFLGLTPIGFLYRQARIDVQKPVGLWGAYVMGLGLCDRLDAVHRADPRRDPGGCGVKETVAKGAGLLAVYSFGLGLPFLVAAFAVSRLRHSWRAFALISPMSSGSWAACSCSPALAFCPASSRN
jgi:Cytochrome c biogenesis protein